MNSAQARQLIKDTFSQTFDKARFGNLAVNLLNRIDDSKAFARNNQYIKDAFKDHVDRFERLGTYTSPDNEKIDVLIVHLTKVAKIERARTAIRNFVADHLKERDGKEAALVAFVSPTEQQWRFSYVKMEYATVEKDSGKVGIETRLTPARRFSYLVGEGESCHTAQTRFLTLLQDTAIDPTLTQIEEAFSVEAVSDEFFKKYRSLFEDTLAALDKLVAKDKTLRDEFNTKGVNAVDFAKKLMGQIVFLYFLQKKGWLGVEKGKDWGTGPRDFLRRLAKGEYCKYDNFFNNILEPLFYNTLANDRGHEAWCDRFKCRIPFLNGGLFEPLGDYDWKKTDILLPNHLFSNSEFVEEGITGTGVLDVFDRYNFTVNEAEPLEKEVAIDPEMLGKVFENLIEENRRKGMGAFYTPREIVHYMCQESLINYLDTSVNKDKQLCPRAEIETFVHLGEQISHYEAVEAQYAIKMPKCIEKNARALDDALKAITVCDPAVGSGAFPVGMMTEIVRARSVLTPYFNDIHERTPYHFKRHAIQNCLYGVDIDAGAVEIAKLRLWLSLVVDEEDVRQIKPLPNLDYKIVQGNSLIELLVSESLVSTVDHRRTVLVKELKKAKDELFNVTIPTQKDIKRHEIDILMKKLFEYDRDIQIKGMKDAVLAVKSQQRLLLFKDNKEQKEDEKKIREIEDKIEEIMNIDIPGPTEHFEWHINYSEIFQEINGFAVVIGNPPYVRVQNLPHEIIDLYKRTWSTAWKRIDISTLFMELAMRVCRRDGIASFISSNQFLATEYGRKTREFFLNHAGFKKMLDMADLPVFDNTLTYVSVFFQQPFATCDFLYSKVNKLPFSPETLTWETISTATLGSDVWVLGASLETQLVNKLVSEKAKLCDYAKCWAGLITGMDALLLFEKDDERIDGVEKDMLLPVLRAESCDRFCLAKPTRFTIYPYSEVNGKTTLIPEQALKREYPKVHAYLKKHKDILAARKDSRTTLGDKGTWHGLVRFGRRSLFRREKIVSPGEVRHNKFALDKTGSAFSCARVFAITSESDKLPLLFLIGVLNSKLVEFYLHKVAPLKQGGYYSYNASVLDAIPISLAALLPEKQNPIKRLVEQIVSTKQRVPAADTTALEQEIDSLVYDLYDLTPEEIKIVEGGSSHE